MTVVAVNVRILSAAGALVLDLASAGFIVRSLSALNRTWKSTDLTSPFVDGDHPILSTLESQDYGVQLGLEGASWVVVEQKFAAVQSAVEQVAWLLEVSTAGVTRVWRVKKPANSSFPGPDAVNMATRQWTGGFTARVQPTPTVSGI